VGLTCERLAIAEIMFNSCNHYFLLFLTLRKSAAVILSLGGATLANRFCFAEYDFLPLGLGITSWPSLLYETSVLLPIA
tara:strand:- start:28 stop:264 length:237 start_codon:yes stop_codon:yes gene_type:complete